MSDLRAQILEMGRRARLASRALARATTAQKNAALLAMADEMESAGAGILAANARDLAAAQINGLASAMTDRLRLDEKRLHKIANDVRAVAALPDPVGHVLREWTHPNGLRHAKVSIPIGVIGIVYESRPNVTSDAAALCLKSGNAVILRGGSESLHSNLAIAAALGRGLARAGLPENAIQLVPVADREAVKHLCAMDEYLDLIMPRGGRGLIEAVVSHARVPVIKHFDGICILYVDREADLAMAGEIALNAKVQRPGVCNSIETLLVHRDVAEAFLQRTGKLLLERGVQLRAEEEARILLAAIGGRGDSPNRPQGGWGQPPLPFDPSLIVAATPQDFRTEFLDLVLAVKVVGSLDEALDHIANNGSHHSDAIVTANPATAERFLREVDSATVYWNASTRFTDGAEFGFGAEIGISTDKLHARGPMGLEELTTYKYVMRGTGQVRS
jgi:glutamate-5-semialdehyde dehydrogenase